MSKSVTRATPAELEAILQQSRHNNALDGVTGLLWADGDRFAQVLEGDERAVGDAIARIKADRRHHEIAILHDRPVTERQFGDWAMEMREVGGAADAYDGRMRRALDRASEAIRDVFASLIEPVRA